jgi:hypothetical protein
MKATPFFLLLFLPIFAFSQTTDPGVKSQLLNYMRATIDSQTPLVWPCGQIAFWLTLAAIVTAVFGLMIAGLQNWSARTWCRVTTLVLGLAIAGITTVTAIFPSYKQYSASANRVSVDLSKMKALALLVEKTDLSKNELDDVKGEFKNFSHDIMSTLDELAGITKPAPAPLSDPGQAYLGPQRSGSIVTAEFRPNQLRGLHLSEALASGLGATYAIAFSPDPPMGSPHLSLVAATSCDDFSGTWKVSTNDLTSLRILQSGCRIEGRFDSLDHSFRHSLLGKVLANAATITIERWDPSGCYTRLYGIITIRDGMLMWDITGSDGKCGIQSGYREHREWHRR